MNITEFCETLIGETKEHAKSLCDENGYTVRIVQEDGINFIITKDCWFKRINFYVKNNIVIKADTG